LVSFPANVFPVLYPGIWLYLIYGLGSPLCKEAASTGKKKHDPLRTYEKAATDLVISIAMDGKFCLAVAVLNLDYLRVV